MKDFRVKITVKNNRLLSMIEHAGYKTQAEFCRAAGVKQSMFGGLVSFKTKPIRKNDSSGCFEWREPAFRIATALHVEPEELWPEHLKNLKTANNFVEFSADESEVRALAAPRVATLAHIELKKFIGKLSPRRQKVLALRFGLDGPALTLSETGDEMGLMGPERVRQIETQALLILKDQMRRSGIKHLQDFSE